MVRAFSCIVVRFSGAFCRPWGFPSLPVCLPGNSGGTFPAACHTLPVLFSPPAPDGQDRKFYGLHNPGSPPFPRYIYTPASASTAPNVQSCSQYFPAIVINADSKYSYETAKLNPQYTNDTDPMTQALGDHYSAESAFTPSAGLVTTLYFGAEVRRPAGTASGCTLRSPLLLVFKIVF